MELLEKIPYAIAFVCWLILAGYVFDALSGKMTTFYWVLLAFLVVTPIVWYQDHKDEINRGQ